MRVLTHNYGLAIWYNNEWVDGKTGMVFQEFIGAPGLEFEYAQIVTVGPTWYRVGGQCRSGYPFETCALWRSVNNTWERLPSFTYSRSDYAVSIVGSTIYVFGGYACNEYRKRHISQFDIIEGNLIPYIEVFDTITETWSVVETAVYQNYTCTAVVHDTKIWLHGYSVTHIFDTITLYPSTQSGLAFISTGSTLYRYKRKKLQRIPNSRLDPRLDKLPHNAEIFVISSYLLRSL